MSSKTFNTVLAKRDGQTQQQRLPALTAGKVQLDPRTTKQLFAYIHAIANEIKFIDHQASNASTWQELLSYNETDVDQLFAKLEQLKSQRSLPAHFSLLFAFLELYKEPQRLLNTLPARHLDFYYHEVLGLKKNNPVPDRAHVVLELKKHTADFFLRKDSAFLAGKDNLKKDLVYKLVHDIIINSSQVKQLKSVFVNPVNPNMIHFASISNSADGMGAELDQENPKWDAFGHRALPLAQPGFCLGSDVLLMAEGHRKITVKLLLNGISPKIKDATIMLNLFSVSVTAEKGWTSPKSITPDVVRADERSAEITFNATYEAEDPAIVPYNSEIHGDGFSGDKPLIKVLVHYASVFGYSHFKNANLLQATISVDVNGMTDLELENDFGILDPKKPFHPFGTTPENDANFWVGSREVFSKQLTSLGLNIEWKDVPSKNLGSYYKEYATDVKNSSFTVNASFADAAGWKVVNSRQQLFDDNDATRKTAANISVKMNFGGKITINTPKSTGPTVPGNYVPAQLARSSGKSLTKELNSKFEALTVDVKASRKIIKEKGVRGLVDRYFPSHKANATIRSEYIHLALNQGFLFRQYRQLFTRQVLEVSKGTRQPNELMREPFAPEMQSLRLDYTATTGRVSFTETNFNDYAGAEIELYHAGAFGHMREHAFARTQTRFLTNTAVKLLPEYHHEGNFYIGLSGLQANDSVCLLFQLAAGSADPELPKADPQWSVLCDNYWKELGNGDFIFDTTNDLLVSGVVKLVIPREATTDNTIMPDGLIWIRVSLASQARAVCLFTDVQSNAAIVEFADNDNDPLHLQQSLAAGTISRLQQAAGAIKQVKQPYTSFGGRMQENNEAFHTRVSERLRHKERAITCWDIERLVLQHFPGIYKVKCINHSSANSFADAGNSLVVLVPDLTNQNAVNPFQPRVDKNTLDQVFQFLQSKGSAWATYNVINPFYEPVKISLAVKLKNGFEFNYYQQEIIKVLQQFLSPWINGSATHIRFGGRITAAQVVRLLEELEYVDYLTDLQLFHSTDGRHFTLCKQFVETTGPASILVSHTRHDIKQS